MSEIERAIELLEEISHNIGLERDTEFAGDPEKFDVLCGKKELIDIATEICRAELDREKNPLTCDGCAYKWQLKNQSKWCNGCVRMKRDDRFKPERELTCTQD